jgi:hypothetical protein
MTKLCPLPLTLPAASGYGVWLKRRLFLYFSRLSAIDFSRHR